MAKIATAAAVNVPGVVRQSGGLTRLTGRDLPRADISMGSDAVAINLDAKIAESVQSVSKAPIDRRRKRTKTAI